MLLQILHSPGFWPGFAAGVAFTVLAVAAIFVLLGIIDEREEQLPHHQYLHDGSAGWPETHERRIGPRTARSELRSRPR